ncbi:hypothetical protein HOY80DRAFT_1035689 [Tuber brumale]|nr:hypothetical protein HOY80DRAFT_1035689 [Tuber brumale]
MDPIKTTAPHRLPSGTEIIDLTASPAVTFHPSPPPRPSTLSVTGWRRENLIDFFQEQNIIFHVDYSWKTFIWLVAKYIVEDREAEIVHTGWEKLANADLVMSIELSTENACLRGFEILSQSRAFTGCNIQLGGS